jgi:hypothetical protein
VASNNLTRVADAKVCPCCDKPDPTRKTWPIATGVGMAGTRGVTPEARRIDYYECSRCKARFMLGDDRYLREPDGEYYLRHKNRLGGGPFGQALLDGPWFNVQDKRPYDDADRIAPILRGEARGLRGPKFEEWLAGEIDRRRSGTRRERQTETERR